MLLAGCALLVALAPDVAALEVCAPDGSVTCAPCRLDVPVLVSGAATLDAVGFDFVFDGARVGFVGMRPGRLVRGWPVFDAQHLSGSRLRVGGFSSAPTVLAGTDTLALLSFAPGSATGCMGYRIEELVDDLAGALTCTGFATWTGGGDPDNGYVAVFPAGGPPTCCFATPDGTLLQVVALAAGAAESGILGADFRIEVVPPAPGARIAWTPAAGLAAISGDPVDNAAAGSDSAGVSVGFDACRTAGPEGIPLGTLSISGLGGEHELLVKRDRRVADSSLPCTRFRLCTGANCEYACLARVAGAAYDPVVFRARINSASCSGTPCGHVAVMPSSWGAIKRIYR
jgi:hypothetical protein